MKLRSLLLTTVIMFSGLVTSSCGGDAPTPDSAAAMPPNVSQQTENVVDESTPDNTNLEPPIDAQLKAIDSVVFIELTSTDGFDQEYNPNIKRDRSHRFAFVAGAYDLATPHSEDMITESLGLDVFGCDAADAVEGPIYRSESTLWSPAIDITRLPGAYRTQLPAELNVMNDGQVFSQLAFLNSSEDYTAPHYGVPEGFVQIYIADSGGLNADRPEALTIDIASLLSDDATNSNFVLPVLNVPRPDRKGLPPFPPKGYYTNFYTGKELTWTRFGSDLLTQVSEFKSVNLVAIIHAPVPL